MIRHERKAWAILWRSNNRLEGKNSHLICRWDTGVPTYSTRKEARSVIEQDWGYIRNRPDLRAEPHGWKMPIAVKVRQVTELAKR